MKYFTRFLKLNDIIFGFGKMFMTLIVSL